MSRWGTDSRAICQDPWMSGDQEVEEALLGEVGLCP